MGKSKRAREPAAAVAAEEAMVCDKRIVLAFEPLERAQWLSQACRLASEGSVKVNQLYDVVSSPKVVADLPEKIGVRMWRTLNKYLHIFSEKQQAYLNQSALAEHFRPDDRKGGDQDGVAASSRGAAAGGSAAPASSDAAERMEEMMARCRMFVREKVSTYDDRAQEAAQKEEEMKELQEKRRLEDEWNQIAAWHTELQPWEKSWMAGEDLRAQQRAAEAEAARLQAERRRIAEEGKRAQEEEERQKAREIREAEERKRAKDQLERWRAEEAEAEQRRRERDGTRSRDHASRTRERSRSRTRERKSRRQDEELAPAPAPAVDIADAARRAEEAARLIAASRAQGRTAPPATLASLLRAGPGR